MAKISKIFTFVKVGSVLGTPKTPEGGSNVDQANIRLKEPLRCFCVVVVKKEGVICSSSCLA